MKHDQRIRFGLIGCGAIANRHMIATSRVDNAEIVGACDIDSHVARLFGEKNSIPVLTGVGEMIEKQSLMF